MNLDADTAARAAADLAALLRLAEARGYALAVGDQQMEQSWLAELLAMAMPTWGLVPSPEIAAEIAEMVVHAHYERISQNRRGRMSGGG